MVVAARGIDERSMTPAKNMTHVAYWCAGRRGATLATGSTVLVERRVPLALRGDDTIL